MTHPLGILGMTLLALTVTTAGCATVRYTVPGREIAEAPPQGPELTLRTTAGERHEHIETAALDQYGPEWTLVLAADRHQLIAQARAHPNESFVLTSAERDAQPVYCGLGGLLVGAILGAALGTQVASHNQQVPLESLTDGISGFLLGGLGGYAVGAIACAVGKAPVEAHLVGGR